MRKNRSVLRVRRRHNGCYSRGHEMVPRGGRLRTSGHGLRRTNGRGVARRLRSRILDGRQRECVPEHRYWDYRSTNHKSEHHRHWHSHRGCGSVRRRRLHDPRVELRPIVHRRHRLHGGVVWELLRRGQPMLLRRVGSQRGRPWAIQGGRRQNPRGFRGGEAERVPLRCAARSLLPRGRVLRDMFIPRRHPPRLCRRGRPLRVRERGRLRSSGAAERVRVSRRDVLPLRVRRGGVVRRQAVANEREVTHASPRPIASVIAR